MSETPLNINLQEADSPLPLLGGGFSFSPDKLEQTPDDEPKSSARLRLLKTDTLEDRRSSGSRRSSIQKDKSINLPSHNKSSLNSTGPLLDSPSKIPSRFRNNGDGLPPRKRNSIVKKVEPGSPKKLREKGIRNPARTRSRKEVQEPSSITSKSGSEIFDVQNLYLNKGKNTLGDTVTPSKKVSRSMKSVFDFQEDHGHHHIKDLYYRMLKKKFQKTGTQRTEDPAEFAEQVDEIKKSIRPPNEERLRDLVIVEKTDLERVKIYYDTWPFLRQRKKILKFFRTISFVCNKIIVHPIFDYFILLIIASNSMLLALDDPTDEKPAVPEVVDNAYLAIYSIEMVLKILGMGFVMRKNSYIRDWWNVMDFVIVVTAYFPIFFSSNSLNLKAFRALRVLRPLRTISNVEALRVLILTLLAAFYPLLDTLFILFFFLLIFAIAGLQLFGGLMKKRCFAVDSGIPAFFVEPSTENQKFCNSDYDCGLENDDELFDTTYICGKMISNPNWGVTNFDTIVASLLMVFQAITLEGWSDMMYMLQKTFSPLSVVYFIMLIIIGSFFLLNLTLAVIKAEFSSNTHEVKNNDPKARKYWTHAEKLFEKLELYKGEVLTLIDKYANNLVRFSKYELKKDNFVALEGRHANRMGTGVYKRRRTKQKSATASRLGKFKDAVIEKLLFKNVAKKGFAALVSLAQRFAPIQPTHPDSAEQKNLFKNESIGSGKGSSEAHLLSIAGRGNISPQTDTPKKPLLSPEEHTPPANSNRRDITKSAPHSTEGKTNAFNRDLLNGKRNDKMLKNNQTNKDSDNPRLPRIELNQTPSLVVIPSIAEAQERSEQSAVASSISSKNFLPIQRNNFMYGKIGNKSPKSPIRPMMDQKIRVKSEDQQKDENIAFINIAGIRNRKGAQPKKIKPMSRLELTPMATPEPRDPSFGGDKSPFELSNIQEEEIDKPQPYGNMMRTSEMFMQMNQINKPSSLKPQRRVERRSTKKTTSGILPSLYDLGEQLNEIDKDLEGDIPTAILDDSDFLDEHQRFELLRKKKLDKFMRKNTIGSKSPSKRVTSNILGSLGNINDPSGHRNSQLKQKRDTVISTDLQPGITADLAEEDDEEERFVIDVRNLKPLPRFERDYEAISLEDVLPSKAEMESQRIIEEEERNLRNAHLPIQFKVTPGDIKKALDKTTTDYKRASVPSLAVEHSQRTKRIKQQRNEEEALDNQLSKAMFDKDNQPPSLRQSLNRATTKNFLKKKTVFSTGGHGHGVTSNRGGNHNHADEDDYLAPEKMNDFMEVLTRIDKPFENEAEAHEEKALKEFLVEKEYREIRKKDLSVNVIQDRNWSGDNVLGRTNAIFPISKVKRALNLQDYDIWRPGVFGVLHAIRRFCKKIIDSSAFNGIVMLSVLLNTIVLGTEGLIKNPDTQAFLTDMNFSFTIIFAIELTLKLTALGVIKYARDKMNLFDAAIVAVSIFETIFLSGGSKNKAVSAFRTIRLFRTFRVLRVTKLLRSLSYMKVVIGVIMRSMKNFVYILVLLFLFLFIFALLGMQIFGGKLNLVENAGVDRVRQNFDSFINAFMAAFQIMSQENWNDILFLAMRSTVSNTISLIYLTIWIFVGNYIFLNLFFAILLDEFTGEDAEEDLEEIEEEFEEADSHGITKTSMSQTMDGKKAMSQQKSLSKDSYTAKSSISKIDSEMMDDESMSDAKNIQKKENIHCRRSLFIFTKQNILRKICIYIYHHRFFETAILTMIVLSSIKLALDTYIAQSTQQIQDYFATVDKVFNIFFALEAFVKVISLGFAFDKGSYLTDAWNKLDFVIVVASLLDMSIQQVQLGFIKILRLLRTLRPLRFITHNRSMRLIVTALLESVTAIINVLIVIMMIWLMFAILAVNIVGGKMGTCTGLPGDELPYGINQVQCEGLGYIWATPHVNFDNVFNAMLSLFILSTQEGWPDIMYTVVDANDAEIGPIEGNQKLFAYVYFLVYMFVGSFFLVNLFIGVILLEFTRASKRENFVAKFLTPQQQNWVVMQRLVIAVKADVSNVEPGPKWMKKIFRVINNTYFDIAIMVIIILNIISMGTTYEGASDGFNLGLKYINWTFSGIFFCELILKHLGLGVKRYWSIGWNRFDAFVVLASALDITMDFLQQSFLSIIRVGPQLARVFRVLRVSRLFKLVKQFEGLQKMINTLIFSLPALLNVGALLFLVYFIYSILATFLFKDITGGNAIDGYANFSTFLSSIVTLFRCSTGENWFIIMFDTLYPSVCLDDAATCGTTKWATLIFWLSFIVICQFIFLNLFVLVILEQFETYHLNPDNPVTKFRNTLENVFIPHWESFSLKHGGTHIHVAQLLDFFRTLPKPLGFKGSDVPKKEIAREVMQMNILPNASNMIFYNDVIYAAFRREFNSETMPNFDQYQYLLKEELKTRHKLESLKKKSTSSGFQVKTFFRDAAKTQKVAAANPIPRILFMGMTMKAWIKYAIITSEKMRAAQANGIDYIPSESEDSDYASEDPGGSEGSRDNESDYIEDEEQDRVEDDSVIEEEDEELQNDRVNTEDQSLIDGSKDDQREKRSGLGHNSDDDRELFERGDNIDLPSQPVKNVKNLTTGNKITVIPRPIRKEVSPNRSLSQFSPPRNVRFGVRDEPSEDQTRLFNFLDAERSPANIESSNKTSHSNIGEAEIPSITINNNMFLNGRGSIEAGSHGGLTPSNVTQGRVRHQDNANRFKTNPDSKEV